MLEIASFFSAIQLAGLVPLTGGTILLGALVAPELFEQMERQDAAELVMGLFTRFDAWLKIATWLVLGGKLAEILLLHKFNFFISQIVGEETKQVLNTGLVFTSLLVAAIAAISFHIIYNTTPKILDQYKKKSKKQSDEFNRLHKESEVLHRVNFLIAFILLLSFAV